MITEEDFLDFACPYCAEAVSFPQLNAGSLQACPNCSESLLVPVESGQPAHKPPLPITATRLTLRRFTAADWKGLLELVADDELYPYLEGVPLDEEGILRWLEHDAHVKLTTPDQPLFLGLELRDGGSLIGYASLRFSEPIRLQAALNLVVGRPFQRRGLGYEAVEALLSFCLGRLHLHRLWIQCDGGNLAACGLAEKAGLRREGEFKANKLVNTGWIDTVVYAILEAEHNKRA